MGQVLRVNEEARRQPRDTVEYRARATAGDGHALSLLVVNTSLSGLMARCESHAVIHVDERLRVTLPIVGAVVAVVRWSLGGRVGCEFDVPIDAATYLAMLRKVGHRPA